VKWRNGESWFAILHSQRTLKTGIKLFHSVVFI